MLTLLVICPMWWCSMWCSMFHVIFHVLRHVRERSQFTLTMSMTLSLDVLPDKYSMIEGLQGFIKLYWTMWHCCIMREFSHFNMTKMYVRNLSTQTFQLITLKVLVLWYCNNGHQLLLPLTIFMVFPCFHLFETYPLPNQLAGYVANSFTNSIPIFFFFYVFT